MKWGLLSAMSGPFVQPDLAEVLVTAAEEAGFESVWGGEHTVMPVSYRSAYPFSDSGKYESLGRSDAPTTGDDSPWSDLVTWFAFGAALTTTLRFGSGVIVLPQRNPVHLAKQAATVDVLSRGRVMLGVGVGWLREEFAVLGAPWEERGRPHRGVHRGHAGALARPPGELRRPVRQVRPGVPGAEAGAGRWRADPRRRSQCDRGTPGGAAGRRVLPGHLPQRARCGRCCLS